MIYMKNYLFLLAIKIFNKYGRGVSFKNKILSSQSILENNFKINSNFSFIQVGANDGISFDFLYEFVTKRKSVGVVIEPIKEYYSELKENYKNYTQIIKINKAIHPTEKQITLYKISPKALDKYPDWVKGIASFDMEHHKRLKIKTEDIIEENVEADNLMSTIFDNYTQKTLNYLQVDTEGFDYEVLKMLDFSIIKPNIIKYESVNLKIEDQKNLILLLKSKGYYLFNEFGDTIGINLKKINLL
jgi:FkbM family methyltransferase